MKKKLNYTSQFSKNPLILYHYYLFKKVYFRRRKLFYSDCVSNKLIVKNSFNSRVNFIFKIFLSKYIFVKLFTLKESVLKDKYSFKHNSIFDNINSSKIQSTFSLNYNNLFLLLFLHNIINFYRIILLITIKNYYYVFN